jgi:hypothetical protein
LEATSTEFSQFHIPPHPATLAHHTTLHDKKVIFKYKTKIGARKNCQNQQKPGKIEKKHKHMRQIINTPPEIRYE